MSGNTFEALTAKAELPPPLGLTEWAEETRRMLAEVYPDDIFVRDPESAEPGCRILHAIDAALERYYEIKTEAREVPR